ncbi:MAG: right-handed parallel beta-helix repeat-containing protein [Verrucomicrobiota bacterium]
MIITHPVFRQVFFLSALLLAHSGLALEYFFTPPEAPFLIAPNEQVTSLELASGTAESAQSRIDSLRTPHANAVLVIRLSGKLLIDKHPLRLNARTCLVMEEGASLVATADATAESLLEIEGAECVSVSSAGIERGMFDGHGRPLAGIQVNAGAKVNLDHLEIRDCGSAGIFYHGRGDDLVTAAGSVTRCLIRACGDGLVATNTAAFMCEDNEFRDNHGIAVIMSSSRSLIAGNHFLRNKLGVTSSSARGVVAHNVFTGNETALKLTAMSSGNLITGNRSRGPAGQVIVSGRGNQFLDNDLPAAVSVTPGGEKNLFTHNTELQLPANPAGILWFDPPTFANPHTTPVIIPGWGRYDLMIRGATNRYAPSDLAPAQEALNLAHQQHPGEILVARLQGYFVGHDPAGLELPANTCVILDGTIQSNPGTPRDPVYQKGESVTQVIRLASSGYCSFSGGTLDGGHQALHGINATNKSIALIDSVNITGAIRDGIRTKGRQSACPLFIQGCSIANTGGRGIWLHVAGNVQVIGNTCVGNQQDGIDVDAHANNCNVLFNICQGNRRHGLFLEEAVTNNLVFGNLLADNNRSGLHVWNEEVVGNTGRNVIAANLCRGNVKGISVGGRAADKTASGNFFFNNVCYGNRDWNLISGNSHATNNYFSQVVIRGSAGKTAGVFKEATWFFSGPAAP